MAFGHWCITQTDCIKIGLTHGLYNPYEQIPQLGAMARVREKGDDEAATGYRKRCKVSGVGKE